MTTRGSPSTLYYKELPPMVQEALIARRLSALRQELGNALLVVNICVDVHRNHAHVLHLLHATLRGLTEHVHAALDVLPAEDVDGNPSGPQGPRAYVRP